MEPIYKVPLIPQNLQKNETVIQIAESLNHLSKISDDVVSRIVVKIEKNAKKLSDISQRITKVNEKVNKLSGAKKATQVFSSSKYPASDLNKDYESIFHNVAPIDLVKQKIKHRSQPIRKDEHLQALHIYHVKVKKENEKLDISGLGELPRDIKYVNDVLLCNSGKNLYKKFVMSDTLQMDLPKRQQVEDKSDIGAAPLSISERNTSLKSAAQSYLYAPNLGEVPTLDVPTDLPDLPGVADDLKYEKDAEPTIAPSVTTTPVAPRVPELPVVENHADVPVDLPAVAEPPAPRAEEKLSEEVKKVEIPTDDLVSILPEVSETAPKMPKVMDARASLMEDIRKAGGSRNAKLKSTENRREEPKVTVQTPGGDLMADLHAKLAMRRKGISGAKKQEAEEVNRFDANTALSRISAMIPPPEQKDLDTATEDEDWD